MKEPPQQRPDGAGAARRPVRELELPEDLWLAQHHGVQPAGDAHHVAHGAIRLVGIHMALKLAGAETVVALEPVLDCRVAASPQAKIQIRPVAGGEDGRFLDAFTGVQLAQRAGQLFGAEHDPLAHADGRRLMVYSAGEEGHLERLTRD